MFRVRTSLVSLVPVAVLLIAFGAPLACSSGTPASVAAAPSIVYVNTCFAPSSSVSTSTSGSITTAASSSTPTTPDDFCKLLLDEQQKALASWNTKADGKDVVKPSERFEDATLLTRCNKHPHGVSGYVVETFQPEMKKDRSPSFSWQVVYLSDKGTRTSIKQGEMSGHCTGIRSKRYSMTPLDDGAMLATSLEISCPDGEGYGESHLFHVKGEGFEAVKETVGRNVMLFDADGDGLLDVARRDLVSGERKVCVSVGGEQRISLSVLFHGLKDGRFALDDDVAKSHLRKQCPKKPDLTKLPPPSTKKGELIDQAVMAFVCAKAWGVHDDELKKAAARMCKGVSTKCTCKEAKDGKGCCESQLACKSELCAAKKLVAELVARPIPRLK